MSTLHSHEGDVLVYTAQSRGPCSCLHSTVTRPMFLSTLHSHEAHVPVYPAQSRGRCSCLHSTVTRPMFLSTLHSHEAHVLVYPAQSRGRCSLDKLLITGQVFLISVNIIPMKPFNTTVLLWASKQMKEKYSDPLKLCRRIFLDND